MLRNSKGKTIRLEVIIATTTHVEGTVNGAIEVSDQSTSVPTVVFVATSCFMDVVSLTGIPHIFDSVILTG
jgi:hypothetical protein